MTKRQIFTLRSSIKFNLTQKARYGLRSLIEDGDKTSTTIVLLDEQDQEQSEPKNDFITLALNESGVQDGIEGKRSEGTAASSSGDLDYEELANEILNGEKDPKIVKKRLKWDRKFRVEEANFSKRKRELDELIEAYKREYDEAQIDIIELEQTFRSKMRKLTDLKNSISAYNS